MTTATFNYRESNAAKAVSTKKATPNQIDLHNRMAEERNRPAITAAPETLLFDDVSAMIEEMKKNTPVGTKQRDLITKLIGELNTVGLGIDIPDFDAMKGGGRDSEASQLIDGLLALSTKYRPQMPPTDGQIAFAMKMFLCPDVAFEDEGITRKVDLGDGESRLKTPEEFEESIRTGFTQGTISPFLDANKGAFNNWINTRLTAKQIQFIIDLQLQLAEQRVPKKVEYVVENGKIVKKSETVPGWKHEHQDSIGLTENEIMMFSFDEASAYITRLQAEIDDPSLRSFGEEPLAPPTFSRKDESNPKEIDGLMFKLEALAGLADEELHELVTEEYVIAPKSPASKAFASKIASFLNDCVEADAVSTEGIIDLFQDFPKLHAIVDPLIIKADAEPAPF